MESALTKNRGGSITRNRKKDFYPERASQPQDRSCGALKDGCTELSELFRVRRSGAKVFGWIDAFGRPWDNA
jgi:hypothetical protein